MLSSKPRKSRKAFIKMPSHKRVKKISGHAGEKVKKETGKRAVSLRKGDVVKVIRGTFTGKIGKIIGVNHAKLKITIEGIKRRKSNGAEVMVPVDPSKIVVEELDKSDAKRFGKKGKSEKK
jgi:large subunit ribosomal protein L24